MTIGEQDPNFKDRWSKAFEEQHKQNQKDFEKRIEEAYWQFDHYIKNHRLPEREAFEKTIRGFFK